MDLKDLMNLQMEFDLNHSSRFDWSIKITDSNPEILEFLIIGMVGELGELANLIKKIIRGDTNINNEINNIEEEISDIFIYLIKMCNQMNINLEESFLKKLDVNKKRFVQYENNR